MREVSIALCTFNGEKHVLAQLESYRGQTRLPDELIVCDDGSRDRTCDLVAGFAAEAPFPVTIQVNEENLGPIRNFEKAISLCSGDIIFLSDQDDVWASNKIERMLVEFARFPDAGLVFTNAELVDGDLNSIGTSLWEYTFSPARRATAAKDGLFKVLYRENAVTGATLAFRSRFRNLIAPIPHDLEFLYHDGWIATVLSGVAECIHIDEPLVKYRQHESQLIGVAHLGNKSRESAICKLNWKIALQRVVTSHEPVMEYLLRLKRAITASPNCKTTALAVVNEELEYQAGVIRHYQNRMALPENRLGRISPILVELGSGRYHRFSHGWRSAARDLIAGDARMVEMSERLNVWRA
jgi:glycosyltransferase involved in cell wall biosynthesis